MWHTLGEGLAFVFACVYRHIGVCALFLFPDNSSGHADICFICLLAPKFLRVGERRQVCAGRTGAGSFLSPSCPPQSGEALSPAAACQRRVLLFQSTDRLTFLLSLLHLWDGDAPCAFVPQLTLFLPVFFLQKALMHHKGKHFSYF